MGDEKRCRHGHHLHHLAGWKADVCYVSGKGQINLTLSTKLFILHNNFQICQKCTHTHTHKYTTDTQDFRGVCTFTRSAQEGAWRFRRAVAFAERFPKSTQIIPGRKLNQRKVAESSQQWQTEIGVGGFLCQAMKSRGSSLPAAARDGGGNRIGVW